LAVKTHVTEARHLISVVFITRKPHPNEFILYLVIIFFKLATFVKSPIIAKRKIPFILNIIPHLRARDSTSLDSLREVIQRWDLKS